MNTLLSLHLLALGVLICVVAAETVIELDGMKDDVSRLKAARLHYLTDLWVEIPAFVVVLVTGLLMLQGEPPHGWLLVKVLAGLVAIAFNVVCVHAVIARHRYVATADIQGMNSTDRSMKIGGAGFIPAFLLALGIGLVRLF